MLKITIETDYPNELRELINALQTTHADHNPRDHCCTHITAPTLIETARKLGKAIEDANPAPFRTGTITTTTTVNPTVDNLSTDVIQQKIRDGNLAAYKTSTQASSEPQASVKAPSCVDVWIDEEINLLRTCKTADEAKFVYESHFPDRRSPNAVHQKFYKLLKADKLLQVGKAKVTGGMINVGGVGIIQSFTDDRQCANVSFQSDPATYQIWIDNLERAE